LSSRGAQEKGLQASAAWRQPGPGSRCATRAPRHPRRASPSYFLQNLTHPTPASKVPQAGRNRPQRAVGQGCSIAICRISARFRRWAWAARGCGFADGAPHTRDSLSPIAAALNAVIASLGRVRRERADLFLLHSPTAADLADREALDCLTALKREGLARCGGVSRGDRATLAAITDDERVEAIEAPFHPNRQDLLADLGRAAGRGAIVIAREILVSDPRARRPTPRGALPLCLNEPAIAVALIGTTDARHLGEAVSAVGSA
jgi:hypothetical protein